MREAWQWCGVSWQGHPWIEVGPTVQCLFLIGERIDSSGGVAPDI